MKKLILSLALIAGVSYSSFADGDRATMKKEFLSQCIKDIQEATGVDEKVATTFCNCSTENAFNKLTDEELKALSDPENASEELQTKMMEVTQPCLEDLMKSMGGQ